MGKRSLSGGFVEGTLVLTKTGFKRIDRLVVGDLVRSLPQTLRLDFDTNTFTDGTGSAYTAREYRKVTSIFTAAASEYFRVRSDTLTDKSPETYFMGEGQQIYCAYIEQQFYDRKPDAWFVLPNGVSLPWLPLWAMS